MPLKPKKLIAAVLVALLAAGCSSHRGRSVPKAPPMPTPVGQQYLALADPTNARIETAKAQLLLGATDLRSTENELRAIASAKRSFDQGLRHMTVPQGAKAAVVRLLDADAVLERRLDEGAASESTGGLDRASAGIIVAGAAAVAAADTVRRSLGLPPLA